MQQSICLSFIPPYKASYLTGVVSFPSQIWMSQSRASFVSLSCNTDVEVHINLQKVFLIRVSDKYQSNSECFYSFSIKYSRYSKKISVENLQHPFIWIDHHTINS